MKFFDKEPKKGMPISAKGLAKGLADIAKALGDMQIVGGHVEWSGMKVPTIVIDGNGVSGAFGVYPFDISFDAGEFTLSNCVYRRGPVTKELTDIEGEVIDDGDQYIAVWLNSETGAGTAYVGASIAAITDATVNEASTNYKILLYKISAVTTEEVMAVSVLVDYRPAPVVVLEV